MLVVAKAIQGCLNKEAYLRAELIVEIESIVVKSTVSSPGLPFLLSGEIIRSSSLGVQTRTNVLTHPDASDAAITSIVPATGLLPGFPAHMSPPACV
jgi:hypothetical protein